MIETFYVCDNCKKKVESATIPCDWMVLGFHRVKCAGGDADIRFKNPLRLPAQWQETHHFCSEQCLNDAVKVIPMQNVK